MNEAAIQVGYQTNEHHLPWVSAVHKKRLFNLMLENGWQMHSVDFGGIALLKSKEMFDEVQKVDDTLRIIGCDYSKKTGEITSWQAASERSVVTYSHFLNSASLDISTLNGELIPGFRGLTQYFKDDAVHDGLYVITKSQQQGLRIHLASKNVGRALERSNYSPDVIEKFDFAVHDLQSDVPSGRLVIVDGPTGSGKTWLLRGLIHECPKAMFVQTPATLIGELNSPEFLPMLIQERNDEDMDGHPLVLIIEDGDACLAPRGNDNMPQIQALLNTADGLLSDSFDLRAIVTTNAEHLRKRADQIDEAMVRNGRMSVRIQVLEHKTPEANKILRRLGWSPNPSMPSDKSKHLLSDIYAEARKHGWVPPKRMEVLPEDDERHTSRPL